MIRILCLAVAAGGWISSAPTDTVSHPRHSSRPERILARRQLGFLVRDSLSVVGLAQEVAMKFQGDTLGRPWTRWVRENSSDDCEPYRGHSHSIRPEQYWAYRCRSSLAGGRVEYFAFMLGDDQEPTIERTQWSIGPASGITAPVQEVVAGHLMDHWSRRFGRPRRPKSGSVTPSRFRS